MGNEYFRRMEQGEEEEEEVERRWVEHSSAAYMPEELPVEWQSWLRHTRPHPPSEEEVAALEARRQQVAQRVAVLEARDKEEVAALEAREEGAAAVLEEAAGWSPPSGEPRRQGSDSNRNSRE